MSEANKKLMARWFEEVWNQGKLEIINDLLAPDAVAWGQAGHGEAMRGAAAFRAYAENLHKAFSEIRMRVEDLIAEGEKVVIRWTVKMKHSGPELGFAATGKDVEVCGTTTVIFRDGKIVQGWDHWDQLGMLHQLGRIPDATPFIPRQAAAKS